MFNQTYDPVCGMRVREKNAAATSEYEGEKYYFCSNSCLRTFLENPAKYATDKEGFHEPVGNGQSCCYQ